MNYPLTEKYDESLLNEKIMGPNPLKLLEELMLNNRIPEGGTVMDLGSGTGLTSVFLTREYGFRVFATDLWSDPGENLRFFESMGLTTERLIPIRADANDLPYASEFFDAVVSTDSYNYFGRDPEYLGKCLLPFVKRGGCIYICVPGMKKDLHASLPPELLLSWTEEQLDYLHDADYWRGVIGAEKGVDILLLRQMQTNEEAWADWLRCDNEYAVGDRRSMEAGGGQYLNFIEIVLQKR